jgi:hypothetical protein
MALKAPRRFFPHGVGCACWHCIWLLQEWVIEVELDRGRQEDRDDYAAAALSIS